MVEVGRCTMRDNTLPDGLHDAVHQLVLADDAVFADGGQVAHKSWR